MSRLHRKTFDHCWELFHRLLRHLQPIFGPRQCRTHTRQIPLFAAFVQTLRGARFRFFGAFDVDLGSCFRGLGKNFNAGWQNLRKAAGNRKIQHAVFLSGNALLDFQIADLQAGEQRRVSGQNAEVTFLAGRDDRRHRLGKNFARGRKNINFQKYESPQGLRRFQRNRDASMMGGGEQQITSHRSDQKNQVFEKRYFNRHFPTERTKTSARIHGDITDQCGDKHNRKQDQYPRKNGQSHTDAFSMKQKSGYHDFKNR